MKNVRDAINTFEGLTPSKLPSITATNDAIYSYSTCIATRQYVDGTGRVIINVTKYSTTTSRLQNELKREYPNAILVEPLPKGCNQQDLRDPRLQRPTVYQPKTGQPCGCKRGVERDNCPQCEGTGQRIDFAAVRKATNG